MRGRMHREGRAAIALARLGARIAAAGDLAEDRRAQGFVENLSGLIAHATRIPLDTFLIDREGGDDSRGNAAEHDRDIILQRASGKANELDERSCGNG